MRTYRQRHAGRSPAEVRDKKRADWAWRRFGEQHGWPGYPELMARELIAMEALRRVGRECDKRAVAEVLQEIREEHQLKWLAANSAAASRSCNVLASKGFVFSRQIGGKTSRILYSLADRFQALSENLEKVVIQK